MSFEFEQCVHISTISLINRKKKKNLASTRDGKLRRSDEDLSCPVPSGKDSFFALFADRVGFANEN